MRNAHTVAQVRAAEAPLLAALPAGALMQRAVHGLLAVCVRRLGRVYGSRVVVLAGGGDNGGDALWTGARLAQRGAVVVALAPGRTHPEGTAALLAAGGRLYLVDAPAAGTARRGTPPVPATPAEPATSATPAGPARPAGSGRVPVPVALSEERIAALLADADLVLDGLLGIGGRGGLRPAYAQLARLTQPARTVAIDVPSGVDADTGAVHGDAVRAGTTVTFGTYKRGLLLGSGAVHAGEVALVGLGLELPPPDLTALDDADVAALLPVPGPTDSKYTRGVLGLVAGSGRYPGAAVLATGGALRGGAGYLRVVAEQRAAEHVRRAHPEAVVTVIEPGDAGGMIAAGRVQAWAIGSGLITGASTRRLVDALLATDVPLLVDAGGLDPFAAAVAERRRVAADRGGPVLLTPHEGEFVRLTAVGLGWDADETRRGLTDDRLGVTRAAAAELGATVLLKGDRTLVVEPGGAARVNTTGTPWLGSAGTGDVLTGLAGSLLATGLGPLDAGAVAAFLHGRAGRLAPRPLAASDLPGLLPKAIADVRGAAGPHDDHGRRG
jgi:hydroxyethylthiazole kinase-like uncharacterized protein yjeF